MSLGGVTGRPIDAVWTFASVDHKAKGSERQVEWSKARGICTGLLRHVNIALGVTWDVRI